ncbi:MAG: hypothetical protein KatS3mg090_0812 [Patescibacteria group bacterium]|nr:MAG: hypothetical protein KatS3mg090_0812 [Patescibacteria group bacterium]
MPIIRFISTLGYILFAVYLFNSVFFIKEVYLTSSDQVNGLSKLKNTNILFLNTTDFAKKLEETNPLLTDINIIKKYPNAVIIEFKKRSPFAFIKADAGYFLIDKKGYILVKSRQISEHYFIINHYQPLSYLSYSVGKQIQNFEIAYSLQFSDVILNNNLKIDSIDILSSNMIRLNIKAGELSFYILISAEKDVEKTAYEFSYFWSRFSEKDKLEYLDLRFDKVVYKSL